MARLFVDVMPALLRSSLRRLGFGFCTLSAECLSPLLRRLSATRGMALAELAFEGGAVDRLEYVQAMAEMIRRNVPIQVLT
jgi:hypothetical protein